MGENTDPSLSMGRKRRRSPAQAKQTENLTLLRRTRSHSDNLHTALADAKMNIQRLNRIIKQTHTNMKQEIRNARKRELRATQRANLAIAEAENLQAQVTELTATLETERQDAGRAVEVVKERHSKMKKKLRLVREQLSRVPSRLERAIQKATKMQSQAPAGIRRIKSAAGVVEDWARDLIRTLVIKVGVPVTKVPAAFLLVAEALGINVEDTVSDRTCRRIVLEGGVVAKIWLVKEINESASESHQQNKHIPRADIPL